jgi:hypothetical protein
MIALLGRHAVIDVLQRSSMTCRPSGKLAHEFFRPSGSRLGRPILRDEDGDLIAWD